MKRILILMLFIVAFVIVFAALEGVVLIVSLFVLFPLFFFYCPLIFAGEKKEEKTEEAKREDQGRFNKWD